MLCSVHPDRPRFKIVISPGCVHHQLSITLAKLECLSHAVVKACEYAFELDLLIARVPITAQLVRACLALTGHLCYTVCIRPLAPQCSVILHAIPRVLFSSTCCLDCVVRDILFGPRAPLHSPLSKISEVVQRHPGALRIDCVNSR